jgi:formylglycine-generating enzyme required for sulfatase activity
MMRDFDVLMIDENLLLAAASEHQLPPPWPQHAAAYADWLAQHTSLLASARDQLAAIHRSLAVTGTDALRLSPANRQLLLRTLDRLTTRLDDFATGPLARVQRRHALLTEVIAPATAGMDNSVPSGLLPLGRNPTTGLAEFLDLASHGEAHPPPQRDEASGQLVLDGATGIVFVALPASYFALGARRDQPGMARYDEHAADDELGQESVALDAFLLAATELTEAQWARLRGPGTPIDDPLLPATNLDHHEATRVLHGYGMVLPTEAQWEYACRAGAFSPAGRGNEPELARQLAQRGSDPRHLVGVLGPNGFGLYDMLGNVAEWCAEPKLAYPTSRARRGDGWRQPTWSLVIEPPIAVRGMRLPGGDLRATMRHGLPATHRDLSLGVRPARPLPR